MYYIFPPGHNMIATSFLGGSVNNMTQINTEGMKVAQLDDGQLQKLMTAEKEMNGGENSEVYLLAVQRP